MKIDGLKILAIGNSFSVDGMQWLFNILADCGAKNITLGNLYIGGCSLERHWNEIENNLDEYAFYKNTDGEWTSHEYSTLHRGLVDEDWDIITMQQYSGHSGMPQTFEPYMTKIIDYVDKHKTNPAAKLYWHMTWAYQNDSEHEAFANYNRDQMTMYNSIVNAVKTAIVPNAAFSGVIPCGTAIQNARTSFIGDNLTRDGFHLSLNLGRYIASMTWAKMLTGLSLDEVTYVPDEQEITPEHLSAAKKAVNSAIDSPFSITA